MLRLRTCHFAASALTLLCTFTLVSTEAAPRKPLPTEALERADDVPVYVWRTGLSPRMVSQHDAFTSTQVNVSATGQNITGDAANEPSICVDPTNGSKMSIGWRQFNSVASNFRQAGWAYTSNSGSTWTFPGILENNVFRSDPVLASDSSGGFFYLSLLETFFDDMWRSLNGGASYTRLAPATGGDKQWFTIDQTNSTGHGFQYQSWSTGGNNYGGRQFSRSTDGGFTWISPVNIPNSPAWGTQDVNTSGNLFIGGVNLNTGQISCERSTNAKNASLTPTFDQNTLVNLGGDIGFSEPINPVGLVGQIFVAVDRSTTVMKDNVYMLASVLPIGTTNGSDVMFVRSSDGGKTFSAPKRVNDDAVNHNKWHWLGTLSVAPNGRIDSVWLDTRNAPNNTDSQLFYSYSTDGGVTWAPNVVVSNSFNPFLGYPQQDKMGDYITIVSDNTGGNVAYTATFNGEEDVYYVRVAPSGGGNLSLTSAASVKGGFGIALPLTGTPGVEDRSGGRTGVYEIDFLFNNTLTGVGSVTSNCGAVANTSIVDNKLVVDLTGVTCNAQDVTVTLNNVTDTEGNSLAAAAVTIGLLLGDVDGDGSVTTADTRAVRLDQGKTTDATNFREDIDASGLIDRKDANLVKRSVGTSLP